MVFLLAIPKRHCYNRVMKTTPRSKSLTKDKKSVRTNKNSKKSSSQAYSKPQLKKLEKLGVKVWGIGVSTPPVPPPGGGYGS